MGTIPTIGILTILLIIEVLIIHYGNKLRKEHESILLNQEYILNYLRDLIQYNSDNKEIIEKTLNNISYMINPRRKRLNQK